MSASEVITPGLKIASLETKCTDGANDAASFVTRAQFNTLTQRDPSIIKDKNENHTTVPLVAH